MSDVFFILCGVNLGLAAAVGLVLILRLPVRALFGAGVAYGLWILPPLAAIAMLLPARVMVMSVSPPVAAVGYPPGVAEATIATHQGPAVIVPALLIWAAGMSLALVALVRRQARFSRAMRQGSAGPAVVGVLRPRVVTPDDFGQRYTPREQLVVLAHEATHIARHDSRINALAAALRCVNWFNPMVHLLAHYLRIDQELACDARVVAAHPGARRSYAEAMLKTQLAAQPLPLGCYWPAPAMHPLTQRISLLSRPSPGPVRRVAGLLTVALLAGAWGMGVWLVRPANVVTVERPASEAPLIAAPLAAAPSQRPPAAPVIRAALTAERPPSLRATPAPETTEAAPEATLLTAVQAAMPPVLLPAVEQHPRVYRIRAAAHRSSVEPGSAVRVMARMVDPEGIPLVTDLTAFGSQTSYRSGYFERNGSRHVLFTSVEQRGERLWVTASTDRRFTPAATGGVLLASGETGTIILPSGQTVTVTPTVRRETLEEAADGHRAARNDGVRWDFNRL